VVRYSLLRLLIFFGFLVLFWLVGLRNNPVLLLAAAALASAALSYIVLRGMRDEITANLIDRHEARARAKDEGPAEGSDEAAEDAEIEAAEDAEVEGHKGSSPQP
jgi:hypothetical protein